MTESCNMKVSERERERALYKQLLLSNNKYLYMYISLIGSLDSLFPFYVHCTCKTCTSKNIMIMFKYLQ